MFEWVEDPPTGVRRVRALSVGSFGKDAWIVECTHHPGFRRNHDGDMLDACRLCRGESLRTDNFALPVKMIARISANPKIPSPVPEPTELTLF